MKTMIVAFVALMFGAAAFAGGGKTNGSPCKFSSDCESGLCQFDVCKSKSGKKDLGNGLPCKFDSDCASGLCQFDVCKSKSGGKQLGNGLACKFDSDCKSGRCQFDVCVAK